MSVWVEKKSLEPKPYHVGDRYTLQMSSLEQLEKWANDPLCLDKEACAKELADRSAAKAKIEAESAKRLTAKRKGLEDDPFDPRTEVSEDARHIAGRIVKNLWIIFVLLPIVLGILYAVLSIK